MVADLKVMRCPSAYLDNYYYHGSYFSLANRHC